MWNGANAYADTVSGSALTSAKSYADTAVNSAGKRSSRLIVGTSTNGWTLKDCDYLCDGTDDGVEIQNAITALPSSGGEIVILDGTYNIASRIYISKSNVSIVGNGKSTVLKRMWNSTPTEGVITVDYASYTSFSNFSIDGNNTQYNAATNCAIYFSNCSYFVVNLVFSYNGRYGIYAFLSNYGVISNNLIFYNNDVGINFSNSNKIACTGNFCMNNKTGFLANNSFSVNCSCNIFNDSTWYGMYLYGCTNGVFSNNVCNDNGILGIQIESSSNNTVSNNSFIRGTGLSTNYTASQYTMKLVGTSNNYNLISSNQLMGKNYVSDGGTGNTFVNNKYN